MGISGGVIFVLTLLQQVMFNLASGNILVQLKANYLSQCYDNNAKCHQQNKDKNFYHFQTIHKVFASALPLFALSISCLIWSLALTIVLGYKLALIVAAIVVFLTLAVYCVQASEKR